MKAFRIYSILFLTVTLVAHVLAAQPSLNLSLMIKGQQVFRDFTKSNLYYYTPSDYKLATDVAGKPFFTLTQMRYTGTQSTGDAGIIKFSNLLQFKITADASQQSKITDLKTELKKINTNAELQMLPVRKFSSVLVFAPTVQVDVSTDSVSLLKIALTEASDNNAIVNNSYWSERTISVRLSNEDAQLVESALMLKQSAMSFSYAIYTSFVEKASPDVSITGTGKLKKQVSNYFQNEIKSPKDTTIKISLAKADAINLNVDITQWPSAIQKIDINERIPAKYALFDVYCYDFNNELRPDLFEKRIEIKATSVAGAAITSTFSFKQAQPDIYAKSIRFMYAVKFDKPFYYRVTEINNDGEKKMTEWIQKKEWSEILDITSSPDKVIVKPKEPVQ